MRAGSLDRLIEIQVATVTYDEYRNQSTAWATLVSLRAQLINRLIDSREGQNATTDSTVSFRTYFYPGVTLDHRVVFEGQAYSIKSLKELGRRVGLEITAEKIGK